MTTRRGLLTGIASFLAAPAIVRAGSLMPLSVPKPMIIKPNPGSLVITMRLDACDMRAMWLAREIRERIKSGFSLTGPPVTTRAIEQRVRELTADLPIAKIVRVETA